MKRNLIALLTLIAMTLGGNALAADTATVDVSATVLGSCLFDTAAYTMPFGNLDPAAPPGTDVSVVTTLNFTCSNGTVWTLDDVSGAQTMTSGSGNLAYDVAMSATTGTGSGATQSVDLTGTVLYANYSAATPDVYTDTLTINVNP